MFDIVLCHLVEIVAKKKVFVNLFYLIGTSIFIFLSYNTAFEANQLTVVPLTISSTTISIDFNRRTEHLVNRCRYPQDSSPMILTHFIQQSHLINHLGFFLRSQSLFYCSVPKVATRTFLLFITYLHIRDEILTNSTSTIPIKLESLEKILPIKSENESVLLTFFNYLRSNNRMNSSEIDLWQIHQKHLFPLIRLRTLKDPSILFSSSFQRVIFVRHPLERLASAYVDKISRIHSKPFSFYDEIRRSICRRFSSIYLTIKEQRSYRRNPRLKTRIDEPCAKIIPTFEHFIDFLTSDSIQNDVHWQPFSSLCRVCLFKYNFIGKYETLIDDYSRLLSRLGLNSTEWLGNNPFSTGRTKQTYRSMFDNLSQRNFCFLKNFYREDLTNFQYDFDEYFPSNRSMNCSNERFRHFPRHSL